MTKKDLEDLRIKKLIGEKYPKMSLYYAGYPQFRPHYVFLMDWIKNNLSYEDTILEVGCGCGLFGVWLQQEGYNNYTGVDISPPLIEIGCSVLELDLRVMDGANLLFEDNSYDFVGYMNSFFEFKSGVTEKFIAEAMRVSKKWAEFDTADRTDYYPAPAKTQIYEWIDDKIVVDAKLSQDRRLYIARSDK